MANTLARAHVGPTPARGAGPRSHVENCPTSDDEDEAIDATIPRSRQEKRNAKKHKDFVRVHTCPEPTPEASYKKSPPNRPPKKAKSPPSSTFTPVIPSPLGPSMSKTLYSLLVCSIGNPGAQYKNTLHSAGHYVLDVLQLRRGYKPWTKGLSGLVAERDREDYQYGIFRGFTKTTENLLTKDDNFTLWKSTSLMNVSGASVKKAWTSFSSSEKRKGFEPRLVVVHDELESTLGKVSVKKGEASPRGHNGLKSVQSAMGNIKWWRVGVGIGRPESREAKVVSNYVLRKMTFFEEKAIDRAAHDVLGQLRALEEGQG